MAFDKMKRSLVLTFFVAGSMFVSSGCAPKDNTPPKQEASAAKTFSSHFFLSGSRPLEGLTLEDYAALNGNMTSLLERSGFVYCRGYLTPTSGLHGTTYPTLSVESYSEKSSEKSTAEMNAMIDKFFSECEKDLSRGKSPQAKSNQPPQTTTGSSAPDRV
jgi:hypothetical protein